MFFVRTKAWDNIALKDWKLVKKTHILLTTDAQKQQPKPLVSLHLWKFAFHNKEGSSHGSLRESSHCHQLKITDWAFQQLKHASSLFLIFLWFHWCFRIPLPSMYHVYVPYFRTHRVLKCTGLLKIGENFFSGLFEPSPMLEPHFDFTDARILLPSRTKKKINVKAKTVPAELRITPELLTGIQEKKSRGWRTGFREKRSLKTQECVYSNFTWNTPEMQWKKKKQ